MSQRLGAKLLREHDRLEAALGSGQRAAAASEFEELARQMLDDANYRRDEWPAQVRPDPSKVAEDLTTSLRNFERERVREVAERAFGELDGRLAGRLRERQYSTARLEWRGRMERSSYAPVREKMARRAQYCDSLIALRDRVRTNLARQIGKRVSLTLRSGTALVGKLTAAEGHADDFTIKLAEGPPRSPIFRALGLRHREARGVHAERARSLPTRDPLARGGELDRAQADFAAAKALAADDADLSARAEAALGDVDTLRFVAKGGRPSATSDSRKARKRRAATRPSASGISPAIATRTRARRPPASNAMILASPSWRTRSNNSTPRRATRSGRASCRGRSRARRRASWARVAWN